VILAPASTLHIPANYGARDRALALVGQAAFTVTHDAHRPFVVRAGDLVATDLGTEFVVRAYPDNPHAEVIVREGVVGIRAITLRDTATVIMRPGQRGWLSATGTPIVQPADTAAVFAWTEGRLVFHQAPLSEVTAELERLYDIEIRLASPELTAKVVSGTVVEARPASQALATIAAVLRLEVVETGPRSYTLRAR
jgi:transmembrane sensor